MTDPSADIRRLAADRERVDEEFLAEHGLVIPAHYGPWQRDVFIAAHRQRLGAPTHAEVEAMDALARAVAASFARSVRPRLRRLPRLNPRSRRTRRARSPARSDDGHEPPLARVLLASLRVGLALVAVGAAVKWWLR